MLTWASNIDVHAITVVFSLGWGEGHGGWNTDICGCQVMLRPLSAVHCIFAVRHHTRFLNLSMWTWEIIWVKHAQPLLVGIRLATPASCFGTMSKYNNSTLSRFASGQSASIHWSLWSPSKDSSAVFGMCLYEQQKWNQYYKHNRMQPRCNPDGI